jgi:site-specific DNA-methyltransferase (adenine-specific)
VTIYHGDSREILPLLGRFDLLLTDPPYGIGFAASPSKWSRDNIKRGKEGWDDTVPEIAPFVEACKKSMVWGGNHFDLPPSRGWLAWVKEKGLPSYGDCELCWTNVEMPCRHMFHRRCDAVKHAHPTQKPLALMQWCIGLAGEVQTILDPFAGSGTTGEAAKLMGKRAVLIEREERYCESPRSASRRTCSNSLHRTSKIRHANPACRIQQRRPRALPAFFLLALLLPL